MSENTIPEVDVSAENPISDNWVWVGAHRPPSPRALFDLMTSQWEVAAPDTSVHPAASHSAARRDALSALFPNTTLVIPTGNPKVRSNDTDYNFRAGTDFFYLTGCHEPDAVLVLIPTEKGHNSVLYLPERRDHQTHEFYTDARYGELWVGPRRGTKEAALYYKIATADITKLRTDLEGGVTPVVTLRGYDASVDLIAPANELDSKLAQELSELRLVKDSFEVEQLQTAINYTVKGFEDVVRALPVAVGRGERVIEGIFNLRARVEGNDVGYNTIAASGSNATILHWMRNDGEVHSGDMLLLDAGVECDNLYTADVTRTIPINGTFSPAQRRIYEIVLRAQEAGIAAVKPGATFLAPNEVAMRVLAEGLHELGILKDEPEVSLRKDRQSYRRYTLHGVSHMLGLDVHDCAHARDDQYYFGELKEGFVLTVEPGIYFQANDLTVPEEYRGIGVRIEDDILVTATGAKNLSAGLPRDPDEIEAWMKKLWADGVPALGL